MKNDQMEYSYYWISFDTYLQESINTPIINPKNTTLLLTNNNTNIFSIYNEIITRTIYFYNVLLYYVQSLLFFYDSNQCLNNNISQTNHFSKSVVF